MADKKITDFPEISSIGANDVFLVGGTNATYKAKLAAVKTSLASVTGVKGDAENSYRTGNVNLTPANIGAVSKAGDTMTGGLNIDTTGWPTIRLKNTSEGVSRDVVLLQAASTGKLSFIEYKNGARSETYELPTPTNDSAITYTILTTKSGIGTLVTNAIGETSIAFSNNTKEVGRISLAAGTWVISANLKITGATVGARQGASISTSNVDGGFDPDAYELISMNDTGNHYINVSRIASPTETTTFYLMGYAETTRTVSGRIKAVRII